MEAQAKKSCVMGWIFYGLAVVATACMFIPGLNVLGAVGLGIVAITGATMNVVLQADSNKCSRMVSKLVNQKDSMIA